LTCIILAKEDRQARSLNGIPEAPRELESSRTSGSREVWGNAPTNNKSPEEPVGDEEPPADHQEDDGGAGGDEEDEEEEPARARSLKTAMWAELAAEVAQMEPDERSCFETRVQWVMTDSDLLRETGKPCAIWWGVGSLGCSRT
jgi:hypothetical protein